MRLYILVLTAIAVTLVSASYGPANTYHEFGTRALRQASITDATSDDSLNAQASPLSEPGKRLSRSFRTTSRRLPVYYHPQNIHPPDFHPQNIHPQYYHPQYYHPQNYQPQFYQPQYYSPPHVYEQQESKSSWFVRMFLEAGIIWSVIHCLSAAFA